MPTVTAVPAKALASWLGISDRAVRQAAEAGHVVRIGAGKYDLKASIITYVEHLRSTAANRSGDRSLDLELSAERARLAAAQADSQEMKNAAAKRDLLPAGEVERRWIGILTDVRSRMLAVSSRVHQRIAHLTPAEVALVDMEVRAALEEIANDA